MKAIKQYFHVVLFIMLYKVVLTFKSVDEILVCDHSNESYQAVLSCGTVYYAKQGGSKFETLVCDHSVLSCSTVDFCCPSWFLLSRIHLWMKP